MDEFERRVEGRVISARDAWEQSKPLSRLSNSKGRRNGDGFFLGLVAGLREALAEYRDIARKARTPGAASGAVRR